ncbi:hypothetical protein DFJ73DRAFT_482740 [Zopfochytrium polystomum]|nr:hypothetical protein DFJ73DRAFT_482740 [Zopfochytrium polystomum]
MVGVTRRPGIGSIANAHSANFFSVIAVFTAPLSCQPGTVCCGNACRYASDPICSAAPQVPSYTSYAAPSASPTPSYQSPPPVYSVGASSSAAPVSTPPSTPYSTDAPTYSIYSTPVYGTAAAPSTASSTPSYGTPSPSPVTTPSATPTPYSAPPTSYGTPSPASTPSTTPSYGTASAASSSAMAASSATPTYGSTPSSTPPAPVSTPVYVPPSATSTQNATAPSASPSTYNNCVGVADYQPSCTGPTTYKYCVSNAYVANQQSISCGTGSVCCPATGLCDVAANCPSYSATAPGATTYPSGQCKAGNASMYCTSSSTFTLCTKDGATYPNMKCAAGTVCCPTTNTCDFMYNCPALGAATKKASSSNPNQCAGVPSNESLCSQDQTTVLQCVGGEVAASRDCSADGMFCCDSTKQCAAYGDCPSLCSASANAEGSSGTCRDPFTFVVCQYGSLVIQVPCIEGMACCGKKNKCVSYSGPDGDDQWARTCQ